MAIKTRFFYDWNADFNGFIWPGNILQDSKKPYVRSDYTDNDDTNDVDEADFDIGFNNGVPVPNSTEDNLTHDDTYLTAKNIDKTYASYANDGRVWLVYPGIYCQDIAFYKNGIKYGAWLSDAHCKTETYNASIFLYDVGSNQILGRIKSTGEQLGAVYCNTKNLKYDSTDGWYFDVNNKKYSLFSLSTNTFLSDIGVGGLVVWDEHYILKMILPPATGYNFGWTTVNYNRPDLTNLAAADILTAVCKHENEIVAMFATVPLVDHVNLYTTDSKGKVTSVDYYRQKQRIGLFDVWVRNMRRIWPKVNGSNVDEVLDAALADESKAWMTPDEFYNKQTTTTSKIKSGEDGYTLAKVKTKDTEEKKTIPVWFWVNTLANWCTFKHGERHSTQLCVWNGRNGWDELDDILRPVEEAQTVLTTYFYDITRFIRGTKIFTKLYHNSKFQYRCIKLPYDSKFSQYDENNFQCIKIGRVHLNDKGMQRYPFTTGIPPIMRLPSGELALIYHLILPGMTKKHEVIYQDHMDFINSVCQAYFGKGEDKTINDDWKRFYKLKDVLEEKACDIVTDDVSTLINAEEINTIREDNVLQNVTLNIPRQYPETLDATPDSYVEDWRQ